MPRKKTTTDPLLAALINKLPATGTEWSVDQQQAWLRNMAMAFGLVYGGGLAAGHDPWPTLATAAPTPKPALPPKPKKPMHPFIIDKKGYARRGSGERVLPSDVSSEMFDERGHESDFRTIIWADESQGLNGADLIIHA